MFIYLWVLELRFDFVGALRSILLGLGGFASHSTRPSRAAERMSTRFVIHLEHDERQRSVDW